MPCVRKYCHFFTQESIIDQYVSVSVCHHCKVLDENAEQCQKPRQKQPLPLEARGLPSNTWMPGPTPLTTHHAKRQLDRYTHFHTTSQQSPHWLQWDAANSPPYCPFPFDDHHQNLIHPHRDRPHSSPETASRSNQPFCHNSHVRTDRWDLWQVNHISALLCFDSERHTNKVFLHYISDYICLRKVDNTVLWRTVLWLITAVAIFDGSRKLMSTYWRTGAGRFWRASCFCIAAHQPWFTVISSVTIFSLPARLVLWR